MAGVPIEGGLEKSLVHWDLENGHEFLQVIRAFLRREFGFNPQDLETQKEDRLVFHYGFSTLGVSVIYVISSIDGRNEVLLEAALGQCQNPSDLGKLSHFALTSNRDLSHPFRYCLNREGVVFLQGRFSADELTQDYFRTLLEAFSAVLPEIMRELHAEVPFKPYLEPEPETPRVA